MIQINQQLAADEAQWYERVYNALSIVEAVASASAVIESASALSQFNNGSNATAAAAATGSSNDTVVLVLLIVLLVTSGINTIVNRLRAFLAPDVHARVAREMSAAHSALARKIDVQLHLSTARRRPAADVLNETLEQYESIVSTGSAVRLDRDLPNATALRSWFRGSGGGQRFLDGDDVAEHMAVHIAPPPPSPLLSSSSPSPSPPDDITTVADDEFLRSDARSQAVIDLLEYQMLRLTENV